MGYEVLAATSGPQAIALARQHGDRIRGVLLDIVMPGMGGGQTFDALREILPDVRVLLSSGFSFEGQAQAIMARGATGFIKKPFDAATLAQRLGEVLQPVPAVRPQAPTRPPGPREP
jgi:CheY-like chemotaxis protein